MKDRVQNYFQWLKVNWKFMVATGVIFAIMFEMVWLAAQSVKQVKENQDKNTQQLVELINKTDQNSKALECIKRSLGVSETIRSEEVEKCQRDSQKPTEESGFIPNFGFDAQSSPAASVFSTPVQGENNDRGGNNGNGDGQGRFLFPPGQGVIRNDVPVAGGL